MENDAKEDLQSSLSKKFHKNLIKKRKMPGGKYADYVEGSSVIRRLNECFGHEWSFEVREKTIGTDHIIVLGRLEYPGPNGSFYVKEQWGGSDIMRFKGSQQIVNLGNDMKAATTDSLKKCATLIGIALHLYEQDEYRGTTDDGTPSSSGKKISMSKSEKEGVSSAVEKCSKVQINAINKVLSATKGEKTSKDLEKFIGKKVEELTVEEAGQVITKKHKFWS